MKYEEVISCDQCKHRIVKSTETINGIPATFVGCAKGSKMSYTEADKKFRCKDFDGKSLYREI